MNTIYVVLVKDGNSYMLASRLSFQTSAAAQRFATAVSGIVAFGDFLGINPPELKTALTAPDRAPRKQTMVFASSPALPIVSSPDAITLPPPSAPSVPGSNPRHPLVRRPTLASFAAVRAPDSVRAPTRTSETVYSHIRPEESSP